MPVSGGGISTGLLAPDVAVEKHMGEVELAQANSRLSPLPRLKLPEECEGDGSTGGAGGDRVSARAGATAGNPGATAGTTPVRLSILQNLVERRDGSALSVANGSSRSEAVNARRSQAGLAQLPL